MFLPFMPFNTVRGLSLVVVTYFFLFALRTLVHIFLVGKCYREKSKIDMVRDMLLINQVQRYISETTKQDIDFCFVQMLPTFSSNLLNMNPFTKGEK